MKTEEAISIRLTKNGLTVALISCIILFLILGQSYKMKDFKNNQKMLLIQVNKLQSVNEDLEEQISDIESDVDELQARIEELE